MLRRIYDWCVDAAHKPHALWLMAAVAFAESSFFPVPPDVMLIPMSLARPQRAWLFAAVCTAASVTGGILGYAIGALLYDSIGHWLIELYGLGGKVEAFRASYAEWGAVIILLKGLTPIPYKLVTITSGFAGYNIWLFILCSIVARGGRFFIAAILLNRYGEWIRVRIEKHLALWVATRRRAAGVRLRHCGASHLTAFSGSFYRPAGLDAVNAPTSVRLVLADLAFVTRRLKARPAAFRSKIGSGIIGFLVRLWFRSALRLFAEALRKPRKLVPVPRWCKIANPCCGSSCTPASLPRRP